MKINKTAFRKAIKALRSKKYNGYEFVEIKKSLFVDGSKHPGVKRCCALGALYFVLDAKPAGQVDLYDSIAQKLFIGKAGPNDLFRISTDIYRANDMSEHPYEAAADYLQRILDRGKF